MAKADIGLDSYPYSGGQTTLECLWMGLPVITLPGETFASRHSLGYLCNLGMEELVARDSDHYVDLAVGLAVDSPRLAALRRGLRDRLRESALCDKTVFHRHFLAAIDQCWDRHRQGLPVRSFTVDA